MSESESLTVLLNCLKENELSEKFNRIWEECYPRLVLLARKRLEGVPQGMADPEDVAASALKSFYRAYQAGHIPNLKDRDDLWRVLFKMTSWKAIDLRRYEDRRPVNGLSAFQFSDNERAGIHELPADQSEEEVAANLAHELEDKLGLLSDDLCQIAVAKLEGYSNAEIAQQHDIALRTVERRLNLIRKKWLATMENEARSR